MRKNIWKQQKEQVEQEDITAMFNRFIEDAGKLALMAAMEREVDLLCGKSYAPKGEEYRRAGSEKG